MGYIRQYEGHRRPPDELIDAWLLTRFPGRTLEELDAMDWARYSRALEAAQIERVLGREALYRAGKLQELDADEWELLKGLSQEIQPAQ